MSAFSNLSRRRFVTMACASTGAVLLKGCLGNPPSATSGGTAAEAMPVANVQPDAAPEVTTVKLGYLPIVEAAPLIIAKEKGFFAKYGLSGAEISKQANWGSARDNVKIGSAGGGIDGGQWQMPMPYLISEGIITDNVKVPMYVLAQLNTQGNGIAIANKHKGKGIAVKMADQGKVFSDLKAAGTRFKVAYTFPKANQEFWIRYWLAGNGIDPDAEVELLTVPTAQTMADMKRGAMDAFSTGDPWPARIVLDDTGFIAALTGEIWKNHPEEYLAIRKDWVDQHPKATKAILKAVMEAQQWCDDFNNRQEMATILAQREYFSMPEADLVGPLMGQYNLGERTVDDRSLAPLYWRDEKGSVSYPYQSHDLWFLTESVRWGFLPKDTLSRAQSLISEVNREDLWREAAQELGVAASDIPTSTSRGVETFFDDTTFDPANPQAYLDSLKIKRA